MNRIIMCDIDGVLNNPQYLLSTPQRTSLDALDPQKIALLSQLCTRTKAKVVLTSSWRDDLKAREYLKRCGIPIIGATPHGRDRGQEIHRWILDKKFEGDYVILDDECSELNHTQRTRLVYTREGQRVGLEWKHIIFAEALFRRESLDSKASMEFIDAILSYIENDWLRVMWNIHQRDCSEINPWRNTGNIKGYKNNTFEVHAYDWNWDLDDNPNQPEPVNFRWRDLDITWYKYCGRGLETNRSVTHDELALMLKECLESLREEEKKHDEFYDTWH